MGPSPSGGTAPRRVGLWIDCVFGPILTRELRTAPRRVRFYIARAIYPVGLLLLMVTAHLLVTGTQRIHNIGDLARFGGLLFQFLALVQLTLGIAFSALLAAGSVAQEKDRGTLGLLLMTRLSEAELVLGKLTSSLLFVVVLLATGLPVFLSIPFLGGVSVGQVIGVFAVTLAAILVAGSLGITLAFWREKTFQSLALTILALFAWVGLGEAIYWGAVGESLAGIPAVQWGAIVSPWRGLENVAQALRPESPQGGPVWLFSPAAGFVGLAVVASLLLNLLSISRLRRWATTSPRREDASLTEAWAPLPASGAAESLTGQPSGETALPTAHRPLPRSRTVWNWCVLWREVRTWAYGRKVLVIKAGYWLLAIAAATVLVRTAGPDGTLTGQQAAYVYVPLAMISLLLINALAVTSICNERDGRTLELLLVTEVTPREFLLGKLLGVLYNTKEMVLVPLALGILLHYVRDTQSYRLLETTEVVYLVVGLIVLMVFGATLGVHSGLSYSTSRNGIAVSLGTVVFLLLGVASCMRMIVAFGGSFDLQFLPFAAVIVLGGIGLFAALGVRNPSGAIALASMTCPLATFYAITSFLLDKPDFAFLVVLLAYGFASAALLVPALSQFEVAESRPSPGEQQ